LPIVTGNAKVWGKFSAAHYHSLKDSHMADFIETSRAPPVPLLPPRSHKRKLRTNVYIIVQIGTKIQQPMGFEAQLAAQLDKHCLR